MTDTERIKELEAKLAEAEERATSNRQNAEYWYEQTEAARIERDLAQRLQLDFEKMYTAAESREKALREVAAPLARSWAGVTLQYLTLPAGQAFMREMAEAADRLRAALAAGKETT